MAELSFSELENTDFEMSMLICLKAIFDILEEINSSIEESNRYLKHII